ncbi:MAG TPA: OB-fold domain-containing protein [Blastocatellia bacterium]|nr:OB-fold domain-containing protein [Blastocatellia bacterium]
MAEQRKSEIQAREGLFDWSEDGPYLLGSRCRQCSEVIFPTNPFCPQCCEETTEVIRLSRRGTLYSFTIQRFKPPPPYRGPDPFVPYGVGIVELPEGVRVTAVLEESNPECLRVGMQMETVVKVRYENDDGNEVLGYGFKVVE